MTASIIIDIVLGVLTLLAVLKFTITGFTKSILNTLKPLVAIVLAIIIRIPVAQLFDSWFMHDSIVGWVKQSLADSLAGNDSFINFVDLYNTTPGFFNTVLSWFGLGDVSALGTLEASDTEAINSLSQEIGSAISMMLSTVLAIIVLFIVIIILLTILIKLVGCLTKIALINFIDKILGFVLGLAIAVLFIWAVSYIMDFIISLTDGFGGSFTLEDVNNSMIIGIVRYIL